LRHAPAVVATGSAAVALVISRNRMLADVPTADVIVVNPTHVAGAAL